MLTILLAAEDNGAISEISASISSCRESSSVAGIQGLATLGITSPGALKAVLGVSRDIYSGIKAKDLAQVPVAMFGGYLCQVSSGIIGDFSRSEKDFNLDEYVIDTIQSYVDSSSIFTVLNVSYDYNPVTQQYGKSIRFKAHSQIDIYGTIEKTVSLNWVNSDAQVYAYGTRYLKYLSRPKVVATVELPFDFSEVPVGIAINCTHPSLYVDGEMMVIDSQVDDNAATATLVLEKSIGVEPVITLDTISTAIVTTISSGVGVTYKDGNAVLKIVYKSLPIEGVIVVFDYSTTQVTDMSGTVKFLATRGKHRIQTSHKDYVDTDMEITV